MQQKNCTIKSFYLLIRHDLRLKTLINAKQIFLWKAENDKFELSYNFLLEFSTQRSISLIALRCRVTITFC